LRFLGVFGKTDNPKELNLMNTFINLLLATALMLGSAIGVSNAQDATAAPVVKDMDLDKGQHRQGGKHRHGSKHAMRMIDTNNDGFVGEDEAASLADRDFMRRDENSDGKLSEAEFMKVREGRGKAMRSWFGFDNEERAAIEKIRKDKFASLDANKDASVDKSELFAEAKAKMAAADTDKDGKVSPWEFRAAR
jgi:hypothetical protein